MLKQSGVRLRTSSVVVDRAQAKATTGAAVPGGKLRARANRSGLPSVPTQPGADGQGQGLAGNTTGTFGVMNCRDIGGRRGRRVR